MEKLTERLMKSKLIKGITALSLLVTAGAVPGNASAADAMANVPCGVVERVDGEVQILDKSRTQLSDAIRGSSVPCGGWVSIIRGWAQVKQRNGHLIHVGPSSFVQFQDADQADADHLVLFKGEIYTVAQSGEGQLRVTTANSRVRVNRGRALVVFNHEREETQLVAFQRGSTIENRFETSRLVAVGAGEMSIFNTQLQRVIPGNPQAVSLASLKPRLAELHVSEADQREANKVVMTRQERKFASRLVETDEETGFQRVPKARKRGLASSGKPYSYSRHEQDSMNPVLHHHWVKRIVGGEDIGERILHPDKFYGRSQRVRIEVEDPMARFNALKKKKMDEEKQRLIEELTQIQVD